MESVAIVVLVIEASRSNPAIELEFEFLLDH